MEESLFVGLIGATVTGVTIVVINFQVRGKVR